MKHDVLNCDEGMVHYPPFSVMERIGAQGEIQMQDWMTTDGVRTTFSGTRQIDGHGDLDL